MSNIQMSNIHRMRIISLIAAGALALAVALAAPAAMPLALAAPAAMPLALAAPAAMTIATMTPASGAAIAEDRGANAEVPDADAPNADAETPDAEPPDAPDAPDAETPDAEASNAETADAEAPDADVLVRAVFDHFRGRASVATVKMTIHRPDWERTMTLKGWTRGTADSVFTIIEPPRDRGNGTLKKGDRMWTYNPKINRVIKLPPSMMSQSWMGSDFSNNDLAKSDSLLNDYTHTVTGREVRGGRAAFWVESTPRPGAPVVWGLQRLLIRNDHILLEEHFYDEDRLPVKSLATEDIRMMGGRLFPAVWTMARADAKDEYTRMVYESLEFREDLPDRLFTVPALKTLR